MTPSQRQLSATIAKSINSMSSADASKTVRQGAVNLLDEYLRLTPANHAILITSTEVDGTGTADMSLLLNDAMPQHIAGSVAEHAQQIKALLAQAAAESAAPPLVVEVKVEISQIKPQTSPDELHGAARPDAIDGAKGAPSLPSSAAPSHQDPMADSPTPSIDSLGGPLRAIQPVQDNAANTLINVAPPPPMPIPVTVTALPLPGDGVSPLATRSGKGARLAARAADENMPMVHRLAYILPYSDNNVNGVDDGYRWRKYGRKTVAGQNYQRHYFKCSNSTCAARRHTECYPPDPTKIQVTYEPTPHNHPPPFVQAAEAFAQLLKQEGYPPNSMWILGTSTPATLPAPARPRSKASRAPRTAPVPIPASHLTFMEAVLPTDPSVPLPRFEPLGGLPSPLLEAPPRGKRSRAAADPLGAWDSDASAEADVMIFADAISRMQVGGAC